MACVHAAEVHPTVVTFIGIMDKIFVFFSSSTTPWEVLKSKVKKTVKKHCETKWSLYYNAVEVIQENVDEIISCLEHFEGGRFSSETKSDAYLLLQSLQQFTFVSLLKFWCPILSSVQRVTKRLQDPKIDLIQASDDLDGLNRIIYLKSKDIIKNAVRLASEYCEKCNVPLARVRRRKMMPGESVKDDGLSAIEEMKRIINEIANRLKTELSERSGRVCRLADKFSFLVKLDSIDVEKMKHLNTMKLQSQNFANHFETDVNSSFLYEEIVDCLTLFRSENRAFPKNAKDFLASLVEIGWHVFPTLCIAYRLLLTIGYSIASCEQSFSKLKQKETYLRSSMSNQGLSSLSLISNEKQFLTSEVKEAVVQTFADSKGAIGQRNKRLAFC